MNFEDYQNELVAAYSTRHGGVSEGIYESMNLSLSMPDDPENIRRNYEIWCDMLGVDIRRTVMVDQTHSACVIPVTEENLGEGLFRERIHGVDGMVTNCRNVALITSHADCVPLYFYDPVRKAIGMTHAGWRGTVGEIAAETIRVLREEYRSRPEDIVARIGPCISQRYFECDRDVIDEIRKMDVDGTEYFYYSGETGKYHVDLPGLNAEVMRKAGVLPEHIEQTGICTYEREDLYFSHRRQGRNRGGQAALLMMR